MTIQATPAELDSVHGDLIYTVAEIVKTADPGTYPNYKFVADVYIGHSAETQIHAARIKKVPDPSSRIGIFNIGQIVRNYISMEFSPKTPYAVALHYESQIFREGEYSVFVTVKFGEEYGYTTYTNIVTDTDRHFFNNYNGRLIGTTSSLVSALRNKFITSRPQTTKVWCSALNNFFSIHGQTTDGITLRVKKFASGVQIGGNLDLIIPNDEANHAEPQYLVDLAPSKINIASAGFITCNIDYYTVDLMTEAGVQETRAFIPVCESINDVYTLTFLNKFGGFDSKDFTKVSRKTISIEKKDFGKLPYTVDVSGVVSYKNANNVYNESRSVYSSQYKEKMTLNSDLLTDEEYEWLEELVLSPMVYIEMEGYFFPVVIVQNDYEKKKYRNDLQVSNLTLSIEFGERLNTQFR